ncbi:hypothetical protein ONZ45_g14189 [Pleurotus djamor]|nr:hypothetical protein ONZ45_g14189 [Pleurotus djamor]
MGEKSPSQTSLQEIPISTKDAEAIHVHLDTGVERIRIRQHWWQFWIPRHVPHPAPTSLDDALVIPLANASILAQLTYTWITDIMRNFKVLGYQRTLQASDLWKMDDSRLTGSISDRLDANWLRRVEEAETWNKRLASGDVQPSLLRRLLWTFQSWPKGSGASQHREMLREKWQRVDARKQPSLAWALNDTLGRMFWVGGAFKKVFGDITQLMGPLLVKAIINFGKDRSASQQAGTSPPNVGRGIAMAIGLFFIVSINLIPQSQFFWRSMSTGVLARAAIISSIYKRGVRFTGKSRAKIPNSALVNHISTDVSRLDACAQWFHPAWTAPIQVIVCLIILLVQLGPSALAGFSLFLLIAPIQERVMAHQFSVFHADVMDEAPFDTDVNQTDAVVVKDATFEWEAPIGGNKDNLTRSHHPFQIRSINLVIPRGALVGIVGSVGSGKSSLLQGILGEMRKLSGDVCFCGRVAYCPQVAWIQNATLRDNILFGQPFDEERYWQVIEDACLSTDLLLLPDGDLTEIGEKGINLSGGQRQRVNIARALYFDAEVVIFDDPLSAVDAHVGNLLFHGAIIGSLRSKGKAVILVTHALHFLSQCDFIYTMETGQITERGTYKELMSKEGNFARLINKFGGGTEDSEDDVTSQTSTIVDTVDAARSKSRRIERRGAGTGKLEGRLMVKEKRVTGSVPWNVYWTYLKSGRGCITAPLVVLAIVLMQSSQIINSYTLVWWQADTFNRPFSFYQTLYACFGLSQATFTFLLGLSIDMMSLFVSRNLHRDSVKNIFFAPMSFFDTTPTGRILSVFGKDIDTIDNQLPLSMRMFILTMANVVGAVLVITIVEHYFIIAVVVLSLGYSYFASFYRASARELKRLAPIRWLAIRLDFLGALMVFIVGLLAVIGVSGISPAEIGLVLTYTSEHILHFSSQLPEILLATLTQLCGLVTRQSAEVENYMNSVERVVHYSRDDLIEQEAPYERPESSLPLSWPPHGAVKFRDVFLSYRPGLPQVLRGISLDIRGGEKIGIVGRTGAGKSSLALALLRIIECSGTITLDEIDISHIGLKDLRSSISIIPQEPLLFSGTVRSNLDPFGRYEDSHLWDALRRSHLLNTEQSSEIDASVPSEHMGEDSPGNKIALDSVIEPEGTNLSVVILDEATASVDLETDSKIQRTIQTEFAGCTLLCIAHRLRTIISYDRILVLDSGVVAEFDTPINLFCKADSIFRALCERSNIALHEIEQRQGASPREEASDDGLTT